MYKLWIIFGISLVLSVIAWVVGTKMNTSYNSDTEFNGVGLIVMAVFLSIITMGMLIAIFVLTLTSI